MSRPRYLLPVIVFSQFCGTSLWFAANAVLVDLQQDWGLAQDSPGHITIAVQLGFILGTFLFALLVIADRFSPRLVFFVSSIVAALATASLLVIPQLPSALLLSRFVSGFFLAGIYPVGMKIAAGWFQRDLGRALGFLVGALVLGTAFPHLLRASGAQLPWQAVIVSVSVLAVIGAGAMLLLVPDGPYMTRGSGFTPRALTILLHSKRLRASACGYFGHMWELYALWAFLPLWLIAYSQRNAVELNPSWWTFAIIAIGFFGCAIGGAISMRAGSARVAAVQLAISGICCLMSPLFFNGDSLPLLLFLLLWGITVAGDSPQFSALNAKYAPPEYLGSVLTLVNCIGFLVTVFSIQLLDALLGIIPVDFLFWLLIPGPVIGLWMMRGLRDSRPDTA